MQTLFPGELQTKPSAIKAGTYFALLIQREI